MTAHQKRIAVAKKADVLRAVQRQVHHRVVEEQRRVPKPDCRAMKKGRDIWRSECAPGPLNGVAPHGPADPTPHPAREGPQETRAWPGQNEQRRRGRHDQLMFDHVGREKLSASVVKRRNQRGEKREPTRRKGRGLPQQHAVSEPGPRP